MKLRVLTLNVWNDEEERAVPHQADQPREPS
jgi:hypothetical protein